MKRIYTFTPTPYTKFAMKHMLLRTEKTHPEMVVAKGGTEDSIKWSSMTKEDIKVECCADFKPRGNVVFTVEGDELPEIVETMEIRIGNAVYDDDKPNEIMVVLWPLLNEQIQLSSGQVEVVNV